MAVMKDGGPSRRESSQPQIRKGTWSAGSSEVVSRISPSRTCHSSVAATATRATARFSAVDFSLRKRASALNRRSSRASADSEPSRTSDSRNKMYPVTGTCSFSTINRIIAASMV